MRFVKCYLYTQRYKNSYRITNKYYYYYYYNNNNNMYVFNSFLYKSF